jgi:acyl-coenzyme A synthetase/AMP-(fatty) acid ligase
MVPIAVEWRDALPRNANGKFDRARLRQEIAQRYAEFEPDAPGEVS